MFHCLTRKFTENCQSKNFSLFNSDFRDLRMDFHKWLSYCLYKIKRRIHFERGYIFSHPIGKEIILFHYPIYTCTLAMVEPWPSEVLFTLGELYPCQTRQPREDFSARISARAKCKYTPSPSELFCSYVLYVI